MTDEATRRVLPLVVPPVTAEPTVLWTSTEVAVSSRPALGSHAFTAI